MKELDFLNNLPSGKIAICLDNSSAIFVLYLDMCKNNLKETISSSLQEMPSLWISEAAEGQPHRKNSNELWQFSILLESLITK